MARSSVSSLSVSTYEIQKIEKIRNIASQKGYQQGTDKDGISFAVMMDDGRFGRFFMMKDAERFLTTF